MGWISDRSTVFLKTAMSIVYNTNLPLPETTVSVSVKSPMPGQPERTLFLSLEPYPSACFVLQRLEVQERLSARTPREPAAVARSSVVRAESSAKVDQINGVCISQLHLVVEGRCRLHEIRQYHILSLLLLWLVEGYPRDDELRHYRRCQSNRQAGQHVADPVVLAVDCSRGDPHDVAGAEPRTRQSVQGDDSWPLHMDRREGAADEFVESIDVVEDGHGEQLVHPVELGLGREVCEYPWRRSRERVLQDDAEGGGQAEGESVEPEVAPARPLEQKVQKVYSWTYEVHQVGHCEEAQEGFDLRPLDGDVDVLKNVLVQLYERRLFAAVHLLVAEHISLEGRVYYEEHQIDEDGDKKVGLARLVPNGPQHVE